MHAVADYDRDQMASRDGISASPLLAILKPETVPGKTYLEKPEIIWVSQLPNTAFPEAPFPCAPLSQFSHTTHVQLYHV